MSGKKLYQCPTCSEVLRGGQLFKYHVNAHRRTAPKIPSVAPPRRAVCYNDDTGNDPGTTKEQRK